VQLQHAAVLWILCSSTPSQCVTRAAVSSVLQLLTMNNCITLLFNHTADATADQSQTAEVQEVAVEEEDTEFNDMIASRLQHLEGKKGAGSVTFYSSYTPAQQDVVIRLAASLGLQVHELLLHRNKVYQKLVANEIRIL
jgi:hypothetical protein